MDYRFWLHQQNKAASTINQVTSGLKFFYRYVLHRPLPELEQAMPRVKKPIRRAQVFSPQEIERLLTVGCIHPRPRMFLMTVYAAGLRVSEACHLRVEDILSSRMQLRIVGAKGQRDRYTNLSPKLLGELRAYWRLFQPSPWLFASTRDGRRPMCVESGQVGMTNRRLLELDQSRGTVRFLWKDYADGARQKPMTLPVAEFIRRLCLHLLPPKFVKIRHYGFLSHRRREAKIQQARQLLGATPESSQPSDPPVPSLRPATEKARVCPFCGQPTLEWVEGVEANLPQAKTFCDSS